MKANLKALVLPAVLALLVGCATPERRIRRNPELFASFPPDAQNTIRKGRAEIGFSRDMVAMALGKPRRVYTRETADGTTEIWAYTDGRFWTESHPVSVPYTYRDSGGRLHGTHSTAWVQVDRFEETETLRVEFRGDEVVGLEQMRY